MVAQVGEKSGSVLVRATGARPMGAPPRFARQLRSCCWFDRRRLTDPVGARYGDRCRSLYHLVSRRRAERRVRRPAAGTARRAARRPRLLVLLRAPGMVVRVAGP